MTDAASVTGIQKTVNNGATSIVATTAPPTILGSDVAIIGLLDPCQITDAAVIARGTAPRLKLPIEN